VSGTRNDGAAVASAGCKSFEPRSSQITTPAPHHPSLLRARCSSASQTKAWKQWRQNTGEYTGNNHTCRGCSCEPCRRSDRVLLSGWLLTIVTGCLNIDAVWRIGNITFTSARRPVYMSRTHNTCYANTSKPASLAIHSPLQLHGIKHHKCGIVCTMKCLAILQKLACE